MNAPEPRPSFWDRMAVMAAIALAGMAVLRTIIIIAPLARFDVDPTVDPTPIGGWFPAETLTADWISLVLAAFIYAVCASRARAMDVVVALAAIVPIVAVFRHGLTPPDNMWRGMGWAAAMVSASAMWTAIRTLPRGMPLRGALVAILLAAAGPLLVRGGSQLLWEHAATVHQFASNRAEILAGNGWEVGSPQAQMFERRLMQLETTGWFGFSNVMSSLMAALGVALVGFSFVGWKYLERGSALVLSAVAAGCVAIVVVNGSRGALGALVIGGASAVAMRWMRPGSRWPVTLALAAAVAVVAAVFARGALGDQLGELSLRFRSQYWHGALEAWRAHPWTGLGAASFADAYLATRPNDAPEEIQSAHSMWVDWIAALGVYGALWVALIVGWVACMRRRSSGAASDGRLAPSSIGRRFVVAAILCVVLFSAISMNAESRSGDHTSTILRVVGIVVAVVIAIAVIQALETPSRTAEAALFGGATVLLVHSQVEMTLWNPSSVGWVAAFIAVVAAQWRPDAGAARAPVLARAGAITASLACVVVAYAVSMQASFAEMEANNVERAAQLLVPYAAHADGPEVHARLPVPALTREGAANVLMEYVGSRDAAWERPVRIAAALRQLAEAVYATPPNATEFEPRARRALKIARDCVQSGPHAYAVTSAAQSLALLIMSGSSGALQQEAAQDLAACAQEQIDRSPRDVFAWINLARAREVQGQAAEAQRAYKNALQADDTYYLDPLKQLPSAQRQELQRKAG